MNESSLTGPLLAAFPGTIGIWLFGSHATGAAGPDSDIDLAVLVEGRADALALWDLAGELGRLAGCPVDLVDLRAASTVMQYQIVAHGRRLWQRDTGAELYELFILREKMDFDVARAGLLADIAASGSIYGR